MRNTFDKAKQKDRPKRKEFKVRYKFFGEEFYINPFLIPVAIVVGTAEYIDNKYYESLEWSDEKATKLLNRTLPYVLEWVEENNAYYYCMNWGCGYFSKRAPFGYRRWGVKFYSDIIDFIKDGYENPNYCKTVEKDKYGDVWVKFEEINFEKSVDK